MKCLYLPGSHHLIALIISPWVIYESVLGSDGYIDRVRKNDLDR